MNGSGVAPRALQLLGPSTGGIRVHVATLAAGLADEGFDAPVVGPPHVLEGLGPQAGVVRVPAGLSPSGLVRARRDLAPWRTAVDIVHAHGLKAAWVGLDARRRIPLVVTVHNVVLDEAAGRSAALQRQLERLVLARADRVIAPTPRMARELGRHVRPERLRIVVPASPSPHLDRSRSEVRARLRVADDTPLVVCVSRLHPQKDLPTLLRAWAEVVRSQPGAVLALVGEGPQRDQLEAQARTLGVAGSVRFCGFRPHAVDEIAAADAMVLTSLWEAIPLVLVEALQLGVPVVSTDVGLAAEVLADGTGGRVVPVGRPDAVAAALVELLEDPVAARRRGADAAASARERFAPQRLVAEVAAVYRELV